MISIVGIHLVCGTKIHASGRAIVPQLELNRHTWNLTDLQKIKIKHVMEPVSFESLELGWNGWGGVREEANHLQMKESSPSKKKTRTCCFSLCH